MANHSSILAWRIPWAEEPGESQTQLSARTTTAASAVLREEAFRPPFPPPLPPNSPAVLSAQGGRRVGDQMGPWGSPERQPGVTGPSPRAQGTSGGHILVPQGRRGLEQNDTRLFSCRMMPVSESSKGSNCFLGSQTSQKRGDLAARVVPSLLVTSCE